MCGNLYRLQEGKTLAHRSSSSWDVLPCPQAAPRLNVAVCGNTTLIEKVMTARHKAAEENQSETADQENPIRPPPI